VTDPGILRSEVALGIEEMSMFCPKLLGTAVKPGIQESQEGEQI
jgi:hypothetical protein